MRRMTGGLTKRTRYLIAAALAVLALPAVRAAEFKGARVWAGPEYTRIVLDAKGPIHYAMNQDNGQVTLDLPGSHLSPDFSAPPAHGLYQGLSHASSGTRFSLIATVSPGSKAKSFVLKPASGDNYRLVLDIYSGQARPGAAVAFAPQADESVAPTPVPSAPLVRVAIESTRPMPPATMAVISGHSSRRATEQAAAMLNGQRNVVVAIDAGHGGKDQGAHGPGGTLEKNVTLAVARDLAADINRQPGMRAVLTRDGDYFIELKRRYQIARENNADLFVSIHADSFTSDDAKGSSVWVLSPRGKTNEAARWLADRENRADLIGGTTLDDKDDSLAKVLLDLQQGWAMQASDVVAGNVLTALGQLGPTHRGYVERANFVVLRSPDVPSILVETAFISNPSEERKLRDPAHQKQLAQAVMGGVKNYFESTPPQGTWFAAQAARRNGVIPMPEHTTVASADAGVRDIHRVGRGESLRSIAKQYGISIDALKNANRINADSVRAGMVLTIPAG
jgi:N-acetylmuramoyl-L-alanine amidase